MEPTGYKNSWEMKKSGVFCGISWMPPGSLINPPKLLLTICSRTPPYDETKLVPNRDQLPIHFYNPNLDDLLFAYQMSLFVNLQVSSRVWLKLYSSTAVYLDSASPIGSRKFQAYSSAIQQPSQLLHLNKRALLSACGGIGHLDVCRCTGTSNKSYQWTQSENARIA